MTKQGETSSKDFAAQQAHIEQAIQNACQTCFGVVDTNFLCRSISVLEPKKPLAVLESETVEKVVALLQENRIGCVIVLDGQGKLRGIFSERDVLLKIVGKFESVRHSRIEEFMTPDPVTQPPDATIGFVLNLMSNGGFRHMPIVDQDNIPIGVISIKDVVDFIVKSFTDSLLAFETT